MTTKTEKRLAKVEELKAKGLSTARAIARVRWSAGAYYSAKKYQVKNRPERKPAYTVIPLRPAVKDQAYMIVGSPSALASFWKATGG